MGNGEKVLRKVACFCSYLNRDMVNSRSKVSIPCV